MSEEVKAKAGEARQAVEVFQGSDLLTPDEQLALRILREAFEDIERGGDLSPAPEGRQKMRLVRRLEVRFFHPEAGRVVVADEARVLAEVPLADSTPVVLKA